MRLIISTRYEYDTVRTLLSLVESSLVERLAREVRMYVSTYVSLRTCNSLLRYVHTYPRTLNPDNRASTRINEISPNKSTRRQVHILLLAQHRRKCTFQNAVGRVATVDNSSTWKIPISTTYFR